MAEQISLACPECSTKLMLNTTAGNLAKKQVRCPKCSTSFAADGAISEPEPLAVHSPPASRTAAQRQGQAHQRQFQTAPGDARNEAHDGTYGGSFKSRSGGSFVTWLGFATIAGIICAATTTAAGLAHSLILISTLTLLTGIVVGAAVRLAGGPRCGTETAVFAVVTAITFMLLGKVGAFYVSPDLTEFGQIAAGMDTMSPEETQALIEAESSEDSMIAEMASELEADTKWLQDNEITEDMMTAHWDVAPIDEDEESAASQFLPQIWETATARWNENSDTQKQTLISAKQKELRAEYGIMTEDEVREEITEATSEEQMVVQTAWQVSYDEDWLKENDLTLEAIEEQIDFDEEKEPAEQFPTVVWEEATRRWTELSPAEKKQQIDERAEEVRMINTYTKENAQLEQTMMGFIKMLFTVFAAIGHFFAPVESLICTILGLLAAAGLASGFPANR